LASICELFFSFAISGCGYFDISCSGVLTPRCDCIAVCVHCVIYITCYTCACTITYLCYLELYLLQIAVAPVYIYSTGFQLGIKVCMCPHMPLGIVIARSFSKWLSRLGLLTVVDFNMCILVLYFSLSCIYVRSWFVCGQIVNRLELSTCQDIWVFQ
jgi:hypothetical protein